MELTEFLKAIDALGTSEVDRAAKLGISPKTLENWRKGDVPRQFLILRDHLELATAITADAARQRSELDVVSAEPVAA